MNLSLDTLVFLHSGYPAHFILGLILCCFVSLLVLLDCALCALTEWVTDYTCKMFQYRSLPFFTTKVIKVTGLGNVQDDELVFFAFLFFLVLPPFLKLLYQYPTSALCIIASISMLFLTRFVLRLKRKLQAHVLDTNAHKGEE